jgi:AcrR family transcriptional regulator
MRRDAQENRERILAAAEAVFGRAGEAGSTEEVARLADVGIATVFRHFPTKEALVEAVLLEHFRRITALARELSAGPDPREALEALVREMVRTGGTKIALASAAGGPANVAPAIHDASNELRDAVADVLRRAQRAGAARRPVEVDEVYLLIRALAQATATMPVEEATLDRAVDVVLAGLESGLPRKDEGPPSRRPSKGSAMT